MSTNSVRWDDQFTDVPDIEDNGALYLGSAVFYPERERVAVFIDGLNLYSTIRSLNNLMIDAGRRDPNNNLSIDYKRLRHFFTKLGVLTDIVYYTVVASEDKYNTVRPLLDWLDYNGYRLVTKMQNTFDNEAGTKSRGSIDVEVALDVMHAVHVGRIDHVILISGDGNFRSIVEACQKQQIRVTVIASAMTPQSVIADGLRRQTSQFIELQKLLPLIEKTTESDQRDSPIKYRRVQFAHSSDENDSKEFEETVL